jgi:hypothetical protein
VSRVEYRASPRDPHDVEAELCRLWRENLALPASPERKFQWLYRDAPDAAAVVYVLEAIEGNRTSIVGTNGTALRRYWVAGRELRAAISCDLAVDRAHRSLLPALCLVRALRDDGADRFDLVYGFPNAKAEGLLKRAGFTELGRARRWAKVLRHVHYVGRLSARPDAPAVIRLAASFPRVARVGAATVDAIRSAVHLATAPATATRHIRSYGAPDERWDVLWRAARHEYDVVGARTAAFLRWRFPETPETRFVALHAAGDDTVRAYAVLQFDAATAAAHVRDLFGHHADLGKLLDALVPLAYQAGASSLSVRFLGAPIVERMLIERGFALREGDRSVVLDRKSLLSADGPIALDASRWHLFDVDEDA